MFRNSVVVSVFLLMTASIQCAFADQAKPSRPNLIERGSYLVKIAGCNDCHTPGYTQAGGKVPEKQWLIGDRLGWRGPWGTTYASNLRLHIQEVSEDQWVEMARTAELRPPMPWFNLHAMTAQDLRALYRFIRYLGSAGEPAPAYLPPDREPRGPYVMFPPPPK